MSVPRRFLALCLLGAAALLVVARAPADAAGGVTYAALGDSYSSGEGNPPFDAASASDGCDRSSQAWPRLISAQHPVISLVAHIACSGATSTALTSTYKTEAAQLTQLTQLSTAPKLVTVTIGGNDLGFSSVLTNCFLFNCVNDGRVGQARTYLQNTLPGLVKGDYQAIKAAAPNSYVVVVGYPQLFTSGTPVNCGWLSSNEKTQLNALAGELDTTLSAQAAAAGVHYISVLHVLAGHELCTSDSWVYPIGFSGGDSRGHPLAKGQQALANYVFTALATH